ncbi:MAG: TonB-dependent receptor [Flavobacteriaceae bacterium]
MKFFYSMLFGLMAIHVSFAQGLTQTVSGRLIDRETEDPLAFANVIIKNSHPLIGTVSDGEGYFSLVNVPVGRISIEVSSIGYETITVSEIVVTSAKTVRLDIGLSPAFSALDEIVLTPKTAKQHPVNNLALVSARMLSVEEASRYAGGFDDPARLASSFAGVASGSGGDNAIVVRGNAPKFLQWKIEGVEIPNPNHFANLSSFGGGGLTALSSSVLANSDFMTGAFTAEYNNALAGVFDLRMRTGSTADYEHSVEAGLIGIDLASEGPLSRGSDASYLVNYRYSTMALLPSLLPEDAEGTKYQDLSFKLHLPTSSIGSFSLWGIGLVDESGTTPEMDADKRIYYQDIEDQKVKQYMGSMGLNHKYYFGNSAYLASTMAFSTEGLDMSTDRLDANNDLIPENRVANTNYNLTFKSYYNKRFSDRLSTRTGISLGVLGYDLDLKEADDQRNLQNVAHGNGLTALVSGYTNASLTAKNLRFNLGVTGQLFTLNNNYTVEPRIGAVYQLNGNNSLSFGYGLHSRLEPLQVYFANTVNSDAINANKELDFTKAHHFVLGYDWDLSEHLHLKVEPYYQFLFDVPIAANSNQSLLNLQGDWFLTDTYVNTGKGRNYGLDITLEQYMDKGFYYLVSGSIFNSEYRTEDSDWFNTRFNKNYLFNALAGKEFKLGRSHQNTLGLNFRVSVQGGDRFSKIDRSATNLEKDVVYDETTPFTEQVEASTVLHSTVNYTWNRKKTSHRVSLKMLNALNYKGFQGHRYNLKTLGTEEFREALMIPNLSYKISF